jgi:hypothetical protein
MDVVYVDEAHIVHNLQENNLEFITFSEFKMWSSGPLGQKSLPENRATVIDPFGGMGGLPQRFVDAKSFVHGAKVQHPCFTTAAHDIGIKRPNQLDMPVKWRGKEVCQIRNKPIVVRQRALQLYKGSRGLNPFRCYAGRFHQGFRDKGAGQERHYGQ